MTFLNEVWLLCTDTGVTLTRWSGAMGGWFYVVLAVVVFCETGLVVTPFLPGDALLFGLGVLAAQPNSPIDPWLAATVLTSASILGDNSNYWLGRSLGPKVFTSTTSRFLNREHLVKAQQFYERYGAKTIVLARFIAIVRTFAPFVAGVGKMDYRRFIAYSVFGGVVWVWGFVSVGYVLGNWPPVRDNFDAIVWGIMGFTLLLAANEAIKAKRRKREITQQDATASTKTARD
jgi:membrane-associated protein